MVSACREDAVAEVRLSCVLTTVATVVLGLLVAAWPPAAPTVSAQTDLDAFMGQVLARRDDNWKKLQQYVLDEREVIDLRGPGNVPLWGERRDYTWYLRDGFFVRSPVKFNGVEISESDRVKYERDYLRRVQERDKRRGRGQQADDRRVHGPGRSHEPRAVDAARAHRDGLERCPPRPAGTEDAAR